MRKKTQSGHPKRSGLFCLKHDEGGVCEIVFSRQYLGRAFGNTQRELLANAGDSALGAAALPKLTSAGAKTFARLMMGEHHALHVEGLRVEKKQNITPSLPTPDPFKPAVEGEQSALSSVAKGRAYDSTYIANEAGIHQAVIDWAGKNTPQNAGLQRYMKTAGPVLEKHLREARALQKKMSASKA